jgi:hypothetical protein
VEGVGGGMQEQVGRVYDDGENDLEFYSSFGTSAFVIIPQPTRLAKLLS